MVTGWVLALVWEWVLGLGRVAPGVEMTIVIVIVGVAVAFGADEAFGLSLVAWVVVMRRPLAGQVGLGGWSSVSRHVGRVGSLV